MSVSEDQSPRCSRCRDILVCPRRRHDDDGLRDPNADGPVVGEWWFVKYRGGIVLDRRKVDAITNQVVSFYAGPWNDGQHYALEDVTFVEKTT